MNSEAPFTGLTAAQLRKAAELKDRIEELESQLAALLQGGGGKAVAKPGRPAGRPAKKKGGKRKMSPEGRARIAAAQRRRWAKQKKGAKK